MSNGYYVLTDLANFFDYQLKHYLFNIFTGFVVPFKAHFNEDSPIWLLGRCYHARNHGKGYAYHLDFLSSR